MVLSNKFLFLFLVVVVFVSSFSVVYNLYKFEYVSSTANAASDLGFITLTIDDSISITTIDGDSVDFGACKLLNRSFNITSERTKDTAESCINFNPTNISVRNDGAYDVIVSAEINDVGSVRGGSFLVSPSNVSDILYKVANSGRLGFGAGCIEGLGSTEYVPFFEANTTYVICERLDSHVLNNSVVINFEVVVPGDLDVSVSSLGIIFSAEAIY